MLAEDNQKRTDGILVTKYIFKLLTSSDWVPQLQRTNSVGYDVTIVKLYQIKTGK